METGSNWLWIAYTDGHCFRDVGCFSSKAKNDEWSWMKCEYKFLFFWGGSLPLCSYKDQAMKLFLWVYLSLIAICKSGTTWRRPGTQPRGWRLMMTGRKDGPIRFQHIPGSETRPPPSPPDTSPRKREEGLCVREREREISPENWETSARSGSYETGRSILV